MLKKQFNNVRYGIAGFLAVEAELFVPIVVLSGFLLLLYVSGQMASLARSMSGALFYRVPLALDRGYICDIWTVGLWWLLSSALIVTMALFLKPVLLTSSNNHGDNPIKELTRQCVFFIMSHLLILAPVFVIPGIHIWFPYPILSLFALNAVLGFFVWRRDLRNLVTAVVLVFTSLVISFHGLTNWAIVVMGGGPFIFYLLKLRNSKGGVFVVFKKSFAFCFLNLSAVLASINLQGALGFRNQLSHEFDFHAVMLAFWWILPATIASLTLQISRLNMERNTWFALMFWYGIFILIFFSPSTFFTLNTLCVIAGILISSTKIFKGNRLATVRQVLFIAGLSWVSYGLLHLEPTIDLHQEFPESVSVGLGRVDEFESYYNDWFAARRENPRDKGPIILLAASGGGIRAAAHAGLIFTAADDVTNGKFGQRVFAISGVSGGALGALTWFGARADGSHPATNSEREILGADPSIERLAKFYSQDFITPVVNNFLTNDLFFGITPFSKGHSHRDGALSQSWRDGWKTAFPKTKHSNFSDDIFEKTISSFRSDPTRFPMFIVNTTAATDGIRAVYSSVNAKFPGAWRLDSESTVLKAVSDSSRFAFVSPLAQTCSDEKPPAPFFGTTSHFCREGYFPMVVADGGYADNSGLASINDVLDELLAIRGTLDNVFVIIVKSDPKEGLPFQEGTRFDNGRLISELVAPGYVLDAARSGHAATFENLIRNRLSPAHVITLPFSYVSLAAAFKRTVRDINESDWFVELERMDMNSDNERSLNLPPLGWTIDFASFKGVYSDSTNPLGLSLSGQCGIITKDAGLLCRSIFASNSARLK